MDKSEQARIVWKFWFRKANNTSVDICIEEITKIIVGYYIETDYIDPQNLGIYHELKNQNIIVHKSNYKAIYIYSSSFFGYLRSFNLLNSMIVFTLEFGNPNQGQHQDKESF
eukprot:179655_1